MLSNNTSQLGSEYYKVSSSSKKIRDINAARLPSYSYLGFGRYSGIKCGVYPITHYYVIAI
jgi:hypothetical protein